MNLGKRGGGRLLTNRTNEGGTHLQIHPSEGKRCFSGGKGERGRRATVLSGKREGKKKWG